MFFIVTVSRYYIYVYFYSLILFSTVITETYSINYSLHRIQNSVHVAFGTNKEICFRDFPLRSFATCHLYMPNYFMNRAPDPAIDAFAY